MTSTKTLALANHPGAFVRQSGGQSRQIYGLDLIRFAAAMLVVFHHFAFWAWVRQGIPVHYFYLGPYTWSGWVGVQIFFVLSGFIIAYSAGNAPPLDFVRSRMVRLYPAAWICSTCTLLALVLSHSSPLNAGLVLTWLNSFALIPHSRWIDGSYWTLLVEISFYALVFLLLLVRGFKRIGFVMSVIGIASTAVSLYKFAAENRVLHVDTAGRIYTLYRVVSASGWSNRLLLEHGCLFAIGVLLWLCIFHKVTAARTVTILICTTGCIAGIDRESTYFTQEAHKAYSHATPVLIWIVSVFCIIVSVRYNTAIGNVLGNQGAAIVRRLGLITYPLYLFHQVNGYILLRLYIKAMPDIAALILTVLTVLGASWIISVFLETPIQRWLRGILGSNQRLAASQTATLP